MSIGDQRPLRCQNCGEQIGLMWGGEPAEGSIIPQCYACAATTEAETITSEAAEPES